MTRIEIAVAIVLSYIRNFEIDFFAVPVKLSGKIYAAFVAPDMMVKAIKNQYKCIEFGKNELYARWGRILTPTTLLPMIRPVDLIETQYDDIKPLTARDWEIEIARITRGEHRGDNKKDIDVICYEFGRVECKKGRGKIGEDEEIEITSIN